MPIHRLLRFRYSLRALLVFITLFGLYAGYHGNRSFRERAAEKVLVRAGAQLTSYPLKFSVWPYKFIGEVRLTSAHLDPEVAQAIGDLPFLFDLHLHVPQLSDEEQGAMRFKRARAGMPAGALERIVTAKYLRELELDGWTLPDSACFAIGSSQRLSGLALTDCEFSEEGFARMIRAPRLHRFSGWHCNATGVKLAESPGSKTLQKIVSVSMPLAPEFASFLSRCPNVKDLHAGDSWGEKHVRLKDEFVFQLGPHPSIQTLWLRSSSITDESLPVLLSMPVIQSISLPDKFSPEAKQKLAEAKPHLRGQL